MKDLKIYFSPGVSLNDDLTTVNISQLLKSGITSTDLRFDYALLDKRDRRFMPTGGYLTSFSRTPNLFRSSAHQK